MTRGRELAVLALVLAVYGVVLGRTVDHGYVWDDIPEIAASRSFDRPLGEGIWLTQVERSQPELADLPSLQFTYDSYRPLLYASYWTDLHVWGRRPGPLHATNVALGALAIMLAYLLARRWLGSAVALVPTAVFALHPIQIEAVAYISGRGDLLAAVFGLAATYATIRAAASQHRVVPWMLAAVVAFAASLFAKESLIALPIAIAAILAARPETRRRWWLGGVLLGVALAYLPVRAAVLHTATAPPFLDAIIAAPAVIVDYLRGVVLPFDLSIERAPGTHVAVGWSLAAAVLALAAIYRKRLATPAVAGLVWFVALLGPSLIVVVAMHVVADRYAYAPLLGLAIAATAVACGCSPGARSSRAPSPRS